MDCRYTSYGLNLVANRKVPGFTPADSNAVDDVRIWIGHFPAAISEERTLWYKSPRGNRHGRPNLIISRLSRGAFHFAYDDQIEFLIGAEGGEVWCTWEGSATIADAAVYLRGPILGFALRLRGVVCLHASAVVLESSGIAILAASGGGKSTTAATFAKLGYMVLADDLVALARQNGQLLALPGCPRVNLWPDAVESLFGDPETLPRVIPRGGVNDWWDKRFVDLEPGSQFQTEPAPLKAIYILGARSRRDGPPMIESMSAQDAFVWLTDGTHAVYALDGKMRAVEFDALGDLAREVPVRLVKPSDNPERIEEMCSAIVEDFAALRSASAGAEVLV